MSRTAQEKLTLMLIR